jgi:hypothetical protein
MCLIVPVATIITGIFSTFNFCVQQRGKSMNTDNNKKIISLDRRDLLKLSAAAGAYGMMMNFDEASAVGVCNIKTASTSVSGELGAADSANLFYFIDGPLLSSLGSSFVSRARLAVHLDIPVSETEFVESVILATQDNVILEERRFLSGHRLANNRAPFAIFDNLTLDTTKPHKIVYQIRKGSGVTLYQFEIAAGQMRTSRLDYSHLSAGAKSQIPVALVSDMSTSNHRPQDSTTEFGMLSTAYHDFGHGAGNTHTARGMLRDMSSSTGEFTFGLEAMHGDVSSAHYMRYFLVLDPVGRVLGALKRSYDAGTPATADQVFSISKGVTDNSSVWTQADKDLVTANTRVPIISDCPYVHLVTEDVFQSAYKVSYRLR